MNNTKPGWRREYVTMIGAMRRSADDLAMAYAKPGTLECVRGGSRDLHQLAQAMQNTVAIYDEEAAVGRAQS